MFTGRSLEILPIKPQNLELTAAASMKVKQKNVFRLSRMRQREKIHVEKLVRWIQDFRSESRRSVNSSI